MNIPETVYAQFPELSTPRLRMRETRPGDAQAVFDILSQPEVTRFYSLSPLTRIEEAQEIIARRAQGFARRQRIRWAIARLEDDGVIGSCGYVHWVPEAARAEIGYELAPAHQGQGVMQEALTAMLAFGFGSMHLHRIEALVMPDNTASLGLLSRLGFQSEGLLRRYGFWKGEFHDLTMLSLLSGDDG